MISATMPIAGRISTYTSGCARNQNRCCHRSGLPPPALVSAWPLTTRPPGRQKLAAAAGVGGRGPPPRGAGGREEARAADAIHELHDARGLERGKREQQQERRH